jgi:hypothetical protein
VKKYNRLPKDYYKVLTDHEVEILFIEAQRKQAERKSHLACIRRCDVELKRLYNKNPLGIA